MGGGGYRGPPRGYEVLKIGDDITALKDVVMVDSWQDAKGRF